MTSKKYLIIAVLATFCLTATLFMIVPTRSQSGGYDARTDVNGDGTIDMADISIGIDGFMTSGDPTLNVNVTNWPVGRTLNATLADNLVIPAGESVELYADVNGYSKVTLVLNLVTSETLIVYINFQVGGAWTPLIYSNNTLATGNHFLLRSYEVIGQTILIVLDNVIGTYQQIATLGIYAAD
jgi:hypothetical protein